jgi:hypothetical protein
MIKHFIIFLIKIYQYSLSAVMGRQCRFHPTCSAYTIEAIEKHGLLKGSILAVRRITSCHPWGGGGVDPVPSKFTLFQSFRGFKKALKKVTNTKAQKNKNKP